MTRVACVVIATERRKELMRTRVMASIVPQAFDEILVVGDWMPDSRVEHYDTGYGYICVEPLLKNTIDALVKRDVGALSTTSDVIVYLCDDHALAPTFLETLREVLDEEWDVIVPNRYTTILAPSCDTLCAEDCECTVDEIIPLNNGERDGYCGGHGGVFRRSVITARPWSAHSHTKYWDARSSFAMRLAGARFVWHPRAGIAIEDVEPNATPWR